MQNIIKVAVAGLCVGVLTGPVLAGQIYQCEEGGRKVFSQEPCGADAKLFKSSNGERTVRMSVHMSRADVSYLCALTMRSWEKKAADQRNNSVGYYGGSSRNEEADRQAFVLSHIENLESIAADDPELYDVAKSLSRRTFYGRPGDYTYDAERARAERECQRDVNASIDRLAARRQAEDDKRFGRKSVR